MTNLEKELLETMRLVWTVMKPNPFTCYTLIIPIYQEYITRNKPRMKREWHVYFSCAVGEYTKLCIQNYFEEELSYSSIPFDKMIYDNQKYKITYLCKYSNREIIDWWKYSHNKSVDPADIISLIRNQQLCQKEIQEKLLNFLKMKLISVL